MTLRYDATVDALDLCFDRTCREVRSLEIEPGLVVDVGPSGQVVAVELLDAAARLAAPTSRPPVRYDREADVLYIRINPSLPTTNSELTDDDIVIRYSGDAIIGCTILHASRRLVPATT